MEKDHIINYHSLSITEVLERFKTPNTGLPLSEIDSRIKTFGKNIITIDIPFRYLKTILTSLRNPFSIILLVATILSVISQHIVDAFVIISVLVINISIDVYHQKSAYKNISLLKKGVQQTTTVLRENRLFKIAIEDIVPGDIVILEEGAIVPADGRLIEVTGLKINESVLTGELLPIEKISYRIPGAVPILDLHNMAWLGTVVTEGSGQLLVTATGFRTQFGLLNKKLQETERGSNPFLDRIKKLSKTIGIAGVVITLIIFGTRFGILENNLNEMILFSLAVLVSIIPESLPTIINIALARGAKYLAEEHAVVKELSNIESVGSTSVIITDKTGTLTENSMKVEYIITADDEEFTVTGFGWKSTGMFMQNNHKYNPRENLQLSMMLDFSVLCNRARVYEEDGTDTVIGEPTEAAFLVMAQKDKRWREELLKEYNIGSRTRFIHSKKMITTTVTKGGENFLIAIGAPETIWSFSKPSTKNSQRTLELAQKGLRTIAYAYIKVSDESFDESQLKNMDYLGFVAMRDPIREGVKEMVVKAKQAGIRIIMATGDHVETARYIGNELGIINNTHPEILEGDEFMLLDDKTQKEKLKTTNVFARVSPDAKLRITKILQKNKEIVTMVGDGVNDTLALRQADVGVAMGNSGTDAARSASSIVLTNDNFNTIIHAIFRGRHVSANIRQVTNFLLSTNAAEALVLVMVSFLGLPLPLVATQILLINLVTDGIGSLPFAFKKPDNSILPRPKPGVILTHFDYGVISSATLGMTIATLVGFSMFLDKGLGYAQTIAFTILVLTQLGRLISIETYKSSLFHFKGNIWLWRSLGISFSILILVLFVPALRNIFNLEILKGIDIVIALALSLAPLVTVEIYKVFIRLLPSLKQKYYA